MRLGFTSMARATRASTRQASAAAAAAKTSSKDESNSSDATTKHQKTPSHSTKRKKTDTGNTPSNSAKRIKKEEETSPVLKTPSKRIKLEPLDEDGVYPAKPSASSISSPNALQTKKLKAYSQYAAKSPFPDFPHPTADEARLAHKILASLHGSRVRPEELKAPTSRAGCGDSPSVLDALVRTILSQNTSDTNSTRAKRSMDTVYGGSDEWEAIVEGGHAKLQETIKSGGLAVVKSKVIISILNQVKEKYGSYSLDHLFQASDDDAMKELIGFQGVGPKTASCVLLFCLRRESFAVDTHVWRITGLLGWRPKSASRDETHAHLEVRIPDEDKYGLHILLVKHGKLCDECKAGGKSAGQCELRKAFRDRDKGGANKASVADASPEVSEDNSN